MGSSQPAADIDAEALANWLQTQPAGRLWTVDGEERLAGAISFPCPGDELAGFVRNLGKLRVFSSADAVAAYATSRELDVLAHDEGDGLVFAVGGANDDAPRWLLVEDTLSDSAPAATV